MLIPADSTTQPPGLDLHAALRTDVERGLTSYPKALPAKWLYDATGSALFESITRLPEYYPTRTERALLASCSTQIAATARARTVIELGSGSSDKTRLLLDSLLARQSLHTYVPVDVSASALRQAHAALSTDYAGLAITPLVSDFAAGLTLPPSRGPRLVVFLGGTLGNFLPWERAAFLGTLRPQMSPGDTLLLGVDLVKDRDVIIAAYDDAAGITAQFSLNVLRRLNRELDADFDLDAFEHVAFWDTEHEWIEMRLRSRRPQDVTIASLGLSVRFEAGEHLRTEISAKFRPDDLAHQLSAAGLELSSWWTDPDQFYGLALATLSGDDLARAQ